MFMLDYWIEGDHNEETGVGFVGFGLTSKKLWSIEDQGLTCK